MNRDQADFGLDVAAIADLWRQLGDVRDAVPRPAHGHSTVNEAMEPDIAAPVSSLALMLAQGGDAGDAPDAATGDEKATP